MSDAPALSPALQRLMDRTRRLQKFGRLYDPIFADAEAVTLFIAAVGQEIDELYQAMEALREEVRRSRADHSHDPLEHDGVSP